MAAKEPYDYLSVVTPDYNALLDVTPQKVVFEEGSKNIIIYEGFNEIEQRVILSSDSVFFLRCEFHNLSGADAGTIFDFFHDSNKANGMAYSFKFKWPHSVVDAAKPIHTYVIRFATPTLIRFKQMVERYGYGQLKFKVLGVIAD